LDRLSNVETHTTSEWELSMEASGSFHGYQYQNGLKETFANGLKEVFGDGVPVV